MKKYFLGLFIIIVIVLAITGIYKAIELYKGDQLEQVNDLANNKSISDTNTIKEGNIDEANTDFKYSNNVEYLFIGYRDEGNSGEIISFDNESLPNEKSTYAIHQGEPYVLISFNNKLSEEKQQELLKQIRVEADEDINIEILQNHTQYKINITDFKESVTYYFGDIAPITIERKSPLEVTITDDDETIFIQNDDNQIFILLAPEEKENVTLTFSEEINQDAQILIQSNKPIGTWIDGYNYQIDLSKISRYDSYAVFNDFFSLNGNYLRYSNTPLIISTSANSKWIDYKTGEELSWGEEYQRYYDKILFSPDKQSFIGIIENVDKMNLYSNGYLYYSFIFQEKGKEPFIFEDVFIGKDRFLGYPIQWLTNEEVICGNQLINTKTKEIKYIDQYYEKNQWYIHEIVYDSIDDKIYLLMLYSSDVNSDEYYVDKWIYDDIASEPVIEKNFSDVRIIQSVFPDNLPIKIVGNGIYWSKIKNNQDKVYYVGRDGFTEDREGKIIFANNQGAVINRKNENINEYIWWELGKEDKNIPVKDNMQPFGDDFIYYDQYGKQYYKYDPEIGWVKGDYPIDAYFPSQEVNQYYKAELYSDGVLTPPEF